MAARPNAKAGPRKAARTAAAKPAPSGSDSALAALREEVASLRRELAQHTEAIMRARLDEIPRAEDFQPLADHLYAFAETAPSLLAGLESVRQVVGGVEAVERRLAEASDTLVATHQSWSDSLMRLPRAEDYEPLVGPLREFVRVSPALAETLASVVKAISPLPAMVDRLRETLESQAAAAKKPAHDSGAGAALSDAVERMAAARAAIREGLASLPRDRSYAAAAAHLRELATVSPSLMDWMRQLPALTMPLAEALVSLENAAGELEDAENAARRLLEPRPGGSRWADR